MNNRIAEFFVANILLRIFYVYIHEGCQSVVVFFLNIIFVLGIKAIWIS